jgi:hypothetical protein
MNPRTFARSLTAFAAVEALSLLVFHSTAGSCALLILVGISTLYLGIRNPRVGLLVLLGELVVGSKGYLVAAPLDGVRLSLRLVAFMGFMVGFSIRSLRNRSLDLGHLRPYRWPLVVFAASVALAAVIGAFRGHGLAAVFLDGNAFLYLALWPAYAVLRRTDRSDLLTIVLAGAVWVGLKSYVILTWFAHGPPGTLSFLYHWVRDTGVGEISPIIGSVYRVFFQSQIYAVLGTLLAFGLLLPQLARDRIRYLPGALLVGLTASGIAVSLSRSFWVGTVCGLLALLLVTRIRFSLRVVAGAIGVTCGTVLLQMLLTSWALNFPYPISGTGFGGGQIVASRLTGITTEAAASSRLELLGPLLATLGRSPIWGSGFAQTVTYTSNDPRVRQANPSGSFTTYTFEWGYLDQLVKFGTLGTVAFLGLWFVLLKRLWKRRSDPLAAATFAATVALLATHVTSPYLNHPLGLGWLMVADAFTRDA